MGFKNLVSSNSTFKKVDAYLDELSRGFGTQKKVKPLILLTFFSILFTVIVLLSIFYSTTKHNAVTQSLSDLKLISQVVSRQVADVNSSGADTSFNKLKESNEDFYRNLKVVQNSSQVVGDVNKIAQQWYDISQKIETITSNKTILNELRATTIQMDQIIPGLQSQYNAVVDDMVKRHLSTNQVAVAKDQVIVAERILRSMHDISAITKSENTDAANEFKDNTETFGTYLDAQLNGDPDFGVDKVVDPDLRSKLIDIKKEYDQVVKASATIVFNNSHKVTAVQKASVSIFQDSDTLLQNLDGLSVSSVLTVYLPRSLLILGFVVFLVSFYKLVGLRGEEDKKRIRELQDEYDRNQGAILRLLDEIADLADGDLRSYATVSEDFTGAIADSINFAIDQLRDLVSRIHTTSQEVSRYTQNTQNVTNGLAESSKQQSDEISSASKAINEIVVSIGEVSTNATESTEVAKRSVEIASSGADVVNRSMHGMDTIREQIQETSKRIKRLGESSQEIGNIVSLINDIADQTNILALNAAIQASMAGEAGRGFAVVADEVQRLAERSASATKQIEGLVRTIQADTNEAVISMEHTTSEVVRGANLAKDAGVALGEIQTVSTSLAQLIGNISSAAQLQSVSATQIADTMNVVQEITVQTTSATFDTARSVSELANMAESLRESVSDFKLPE
ncbi:methyl-accepting chemotaxis protein [Acinetobacter nectaris]|uniref:methyl-accepting chemotaxis protein n=1 Tax=Acinetobacter nectaris TaxID=1219382 RepID=UPI001F178580|nr:methyl-accepting chemotaxis protein [Acinetobacter nectaris]MCF9000195.1 methyl-accepting chemotaxis protein [Acinetobacter nectaris]MCF9028432.1 methyl-accepting chemotaxis protein [Acinetobacter nectaris]